MLSFTQYSNGITFNAINIHSIVTEAQVADFVTKHEDQLEFGISSLYEKRSVVKTMAVYGMLMRFRSTIKDKSKSIDDKLNALFNTIVASSALSSFGKPDLKRAISRIKGR